LSGVIRNKDKGYNILFGENTKSTDPIGFELLSLILGESVNKAEKLYDILKNSSPEFLCLIKKTIDDSIFEIKNILKKKSKVNFFELFDVFSKEYVVVTFLAVLSMSRNQEIEIEQETNFKNIIIKEKGEIK
jgi:hypothetical protein